MQGCLYTRGSWFCRVTTTNLGILVAKFTVLVSLEEVDQKCGILFGA